jgi:hypothetical protein
MEKIVIAVLELILFMKFSFHNCTCTGKIGFKIVRFVKTIFPLQQHINTDKICIKIMGLGISENPIILRQILP